MIGSSICARQLSNRVPPRPVLPPLSVAAMLVKTTTPNGERGACLALVLFCVNKATY